MGVAQYMRVNSPTLNKHSVLHWFTPIGPVHTFNEEMMFYDAHKFFTIRKN